MKPRGIFLKLVYGLIFALSIGLQPSNAQTTLTDVTGTIIDTAGTAIVDATVSLINRVTNETRTANTDSSGRFVFRAAPVGSYTLKATASEWTTETLDVDVSATTTNRFSLTLRPAIATRAVPPIGAPRDNEPVVTQPPAAPPPATAAMRTPNYYTMKVFYATDRNATGQSDPEMFYGDDRDPTEKLSFGMCEVSIPRDHRPGELEAPSIWKLEFREDPNKHVVLLGVQPEAQNQFYGDLVSTISASQNKDAFVFIHGYKTTFTDAARRTAQLAYDLNFHGAAIFYSWPSKGAYGGYAADEESIAWTKSHLVSFLQEISVRTRAKTVHLIAHSMGNRALVQALSEIGNLPESGTKAHFREVVLAAPDIDRDIFKQLAGAMERTADRVTLYASSHDEALIASKRLHEFPRAGEAGRALLVMSGLDTVDVSAVDSSFLGHSYYGDNNSVISDIRRLFTENLPPGKRSCLSQEFLSALAYWAFVPTACPTH